MASPYIFHSNFAAGSAAEWDSESDTGSRLDFPHYTTLAAIPGMPAPYSGAYCMRIRLGDTNDHTLIEGDIDIATGTTSYFRFPLFISNDTAATADDNFSILELQQAAGTQVYVVGLQIEADDEQLKIWVAENDTPETVSTNTMPKGRWCIVEVVANVDTAATNGDISVYVDGGLYVSLATTVQNAAAVGRGALGTQATLSTTTGTLLFGEFIMDDAQLYVPNQRFPDTVRLTKTQSVFVGPGAIDAATILSATGTLDIWDTDTANTNDASAKRIQLDAAGNFVSHDSKVQFLRGCYAVLGGTNPVAEIRLHKGPTGPTAHWSDGAIKRYASQRKSRAGNV